MCTILFACYLVTTSEIEMELNKESTDRRKYVDLILEINVNSIELWLIIRLEVYKVSTSS